MIISFKYKEHSAANYTTDTGSAGGTWTTIDNLTNSSANLAATFSTLKSYDIIGKIEDAFTSYEFLATVGTEKFPLAVRPDCLGLGKTPENANVVDSAWKFYYNNKPIQHHQLSATDGSAVLIPKTGTDLNTITESGFYRGYNLVNAPIEAGWSYIRVSRHVDTSWIVQEVIDYTGSVSAYRVKKNGKWQAWKQYAIRDELKNQINTGWQSAGYTGSYYKRSGDVLAIRFDFTGNGNTFAIASIPSSVWVAPQSYMFEIAEWSISGADTGHVQVNSGTGAFVILASKKAQQYRGQILLMI